MAKVSDTSPQKTGQHVCLYGPPKSGKTLLAGMLAQYYNLIWFDLEHGSLTLKQLPIELQRNIELIKVPDDRKNYQAITTMLYVSEGKAVEVCDLHGKMGPCNSCALAKATGRSWDIGSLVSIDIESLGPEWVIVCDSLTQLSHSAMGKAFRGNQDENNIKPEYVHYTAQGFYLDRFLTAVQNSKANWVCISHEESLVQEDEKEKIVPMTGTRNFSRNTARYFDHVVYTSIENYKYVASSNGVDSLKVLAGSRTGVSLKKGGYTGGLVALFKGTGSVEVEAYSEPAPKQEARKPGSAKDSVAPALIGTTTQVQAQAAAPVQTMQERLAAMRQQKR